MKIVKWAATGVLALGLTAAPAMAAIKVATYTGTVESGSLSNFFGLPQGTSLAGYSYVATFVFDTAVGNRFPDFGGERVEGGTDLGVATPIISATLSLTGSAFSDGLFTSTGAAFGSHFARSDFGTSSNSEDANSFLNLNMGFSTGLPSTLDGNIAKTDIDDVVGFFGFFAPGDTVFTVKIMTGRFGGPGTYEIKDFVTPGGVPEPANWAMMIFGFGIVGAMARRRRQTIIVA